MPLIAKNFAPCFGERACRGWVMRAIDDCAVVPLLKTSGPIDSGKSTRNRGLVDVDLRRAERTDCYRGVLFLMMARQCNWRAVVTIRLQIAVALRNQRLARE